MGLDQQAIKFRDNLCSTLMQLGKKHLMFQGSELKVVFKTLRCC